MFSLCSLTHTHTPTHTSRPHRPFLRVVLLPNTPHHATGHVLWWGDRGGSISDVASQAVLADLPELPEEVTCVRWGQADTLAWALVVCAYVCVCMCLYGVCVCVRGGCVVRRGGIYQSRACTCTVKRSAPAATWRGAARRASETHHHTAVPHAHTRAHTRIHTYTRCPGANIRRRLMCCCRRRRRRRRRPQPPHRLPVHCLGAGAAVPARGGLPGHTHDLRGRGERV